MAAEPTGASERAAVLIEEPPLLISPLQNKTLHAFRQELCPLKKDIALPVVDNNDGPDGVDDKVKKADGPHGVVCLLRDYE